MDEKGVMALVFVVLASCYAASDDSAATTNAVPSYEVTIKTETYLELKAENEALRKENQMLRRELVSKNGSLPDTLLPEKVVAPRNRIVAQGEDTGYWIAQNSKIRHNNKCRNYRKVKGRPCGPNDGKPCKMCGG